MRVAGLVAAVGMVVLPARAAATVCFEPEYLVKRAESLVSRPTTALPAAVPYPKALVHGRSAIVGGCSSPRANLRESAALKAKEVQVELGHGKRRFHEDAHGDLARQVFHHTGLGLACCDRYETLASDAEGVHDLLIEQSKLAQPFLSTLVCAYAFDALLAGRVMPGDPGCSKMIVRTDSPGASYQMPPGDPLTEPERCALIQWVAAGAPAGTAQTAAIAEAAGERGQP